ncbi:MAG: putative DNA-binding domain-containing protein [Myxococcota bacterium]
MTLADFFAAAQPFLQGRSAVDDLKTLGHTPSPDADLAMYPWLVAWDQARILAELVPTVRTWVELAGLDWDALVRAYVADHPPEGHSVPHVGAHLADWLAGHREREPRLPAGIEALADFTWTAFLARTAPDDGPDLDRRVFVRHYATDPRIANRTLTSGEVPGPTDAVTLVVYRDETTGAARACTAGLVTVAVLLAHGGHALTGALDLPSDTLATERARLQNRGVLPHDAPTGAGERT